jgi:F-type H+-transporting ATPase subunit gamma
MPNLKDIRNRIDSTKNTQQITRAMKMVSAAKLRRAQNNIVNLRPYAQKLLTLIADVAVTQRVHHPLLERRDDPQRVLVLILTSDRGLCGGFNAGVNKFALQYLKASATKYAQLDVIFIGRKGADFFKTRGVKPIDTIFNLVKDVSHPLAARVADQIMSDYTSGQYDAVDLIYNEFKSAISQKVTCERLLPVDLTNATLRTDAPTTAAVAPDLIFEPAPEQIIDELLARHFAVQIYRCMSESVAAEHGARMAAMESATKNAGEMIANLTLTYNKLRQASITTELIEITSGAEALKG